jgi:hypothetical protein
MTQHEVTQSLAVLSVVYPALKQENPVLATLATRAWHAALGDLPAESVAAAVDTWVKEERWPPTPADIRERALLSYCGGGGSLNDVWHELQGLLNTVSADLESVAYDRMTPACRAGVRALGGWREVCYRELRDQRTTRREFDTGVMSFIREKHGTTIGLVESNIPALPGGASDA